MMDIKEVECPCGCGLKYDVTLPQNYVELMFLLEYREFHKNDEEKEGEKL